MEQISNLLKGKINEEFAELMAYQKSLQEHLTNYLITGGIASAIDEFLKTGRISESTYKTYLDAISGDLNKADREDVYMRQLMPNIIDSLGRYKVISFFLKAFDHNLSFVNYVFLKT